jgi:hypothetical protein
MTLMGSRIRSKVSDHLNTIHQPPHYNTYRGRTTETLILPSHMYVCMYVIGRPGTAGVPHTQNRIGPQEQRADMCRDTWKEIIFVNDIVVR